MVRLFYSFMRFFFNRFGYYSMVGSWNDSLFRSGWSSLGYYCSAIVHVRDTSQAFDKVGRYIVEDMFGNKEEIVLASGDTYVFSTTGRYIFTKIGTT